jgi:L-ascorbate metabolism protein UlaG (beta-lactamase superfamily)
MKPRDIAFSERALVGPGKGSVRVRWLGTAGFEIEHDGWVVLIDPYFSRPSLGQCFSGALVPDVALIRRHLGRVDAIVCSHTHFDHVLDVPTIARLTGARVFGSRSATLLCRAGNVHESQLSDVESGITKAEVGPFALEFVRSAHSPLLLGRIPFPGDIADCDDLPLTVSRYRCGAVFGTLLEVAGRSVYHVGSANLDDAARPRRREIDLALLCAAGWATTERFAERLMRNVSPGAIALSHWDNFFRPLDHPATPLPALKLPRLVESLHREAKGIRTGTIDLLHDLWL